jgi:putative hydroxymethylpyrimidine transport system ATP-binding protein
MQTLAARLLQGRTVLLVTHDPAEACRLAHTLLVLSGSPATLAPPIPVPGLPPRDVDDETVLATEGHLLRALLASAKQPDGAAA